MDWLNQLHTSSRQTWLDQIRKENLNSFNSIQFHEIQKNIQGLSFATSEDLKDCTNNFTLSRPNNNWKIGIEVLEEELTDLKFSLDYALTNGAEYVHLPLYVLKDKTDIEYLFNGVFLDMISINFNFIPFEVDSLLETLENLPPYSILNINRTDINQIKELKTFNKSKRQISYTFKLSNLDPCISILKQIQEDQQDELDIPRKFIFQFNYLFLQNIASFRAIRKILQDEKVLGLYEIRIDPSCILKDINQNLISFSSMALSAAISGPDIITLPRYDLLSENKSKSWLRNSLHLQSILKLESNLNHVNDPLSGSYYVEDLTEKIYQYLISHL